MPRNMSFALTTEAARERRKTVTRRLGWEFLKPGDVFQQVVKGMGLKKGEKVEKIHLARCVSNDPEPLSDFEKHGPEECAREGFPGWTPEEFTAMFCEHNCCTLEQVVNRIVFEYLD